jgi:hypothetical protein
MEGYTSVATAVRCETNSSSDRSATDSKTRRQARNPRRRNCLGFTISVRSAHSTCGHAGVPSHPALDQPLKSPTTSATDEGLTLSRATAKSQQTSECFTEHAVSHLPLTDGGGPSGMR